MWHCRPGVRERTLSLINFGLAFMSSLSYYSHLFGFTFFNSLSYPALLYFPSFVWDTIPGCLCRARVLWELLLRPSTTRFCCRHCPEGALVQACPASPSPEEHVSVG